MAKEVKNLKRMNVYEKFRYIFSRLKRIERQLRAISAKLDIDEGLSNEDYEETMDDTE